MSVYHRNEAALNLGFLLFITAGIFLSFPVLSYAYEDTGSATSQFDRVDVKTIKICTRQILSEPDFAPKKTFWQWLTEKFSKWKRPKFNLGPGWTRFILLVIVIWCVLTLMAVLIHFIWTICLLIRSNKDIRGVSNKFSSELVKITSFEELYRMTQELAEKGAFSEAISIMIVALLRWLDSKGIVRFHESKTNGDYIREYPSGYAGQNEFEEFVLIFEQIIYGGLPDNGKTYRKMNSLREYIHNCVTQQRT